MGKRPGFLETIRITRQILRARSVLLKAYSFTTSTSAQQVIDAIERRWGRTIPDGKRDFYVASVIHQQQVIVGYGNIEQPRIFAARIDFQSLDPAGGTLRFLDAEAYAHFTEWADIFRLEFARIIAGVSPGAELREHDGPVDIAGSGPDPV
jgi:hypothetical protein